MKPAIVADEMFPEGAGFMDLEEVSQLDVRITILFLFYHFFLLLLHI